MSVYVASHSNLTMRRLQIDPGERKLSLSTDIQGEYYVNYEQLHWVIHMRVYLHASYAEILH